MTVSKIEKLHIRTEFREINTSNIRNDALNDFVLMKLIVARFVGTGGFLIAYSNDHK